MLDSHHYFLQRCSCHLHLAPMLFFEQASGAGPCCMSREWGKLARKHWSHPRGVWAQVLAPPMTSLHQRSFSNPANPEKQ